MAPFLTLIFLLVMAMVGFVFDLYLFSRGAFGNKYVKHTAFTRSVSTESLMSDRDDYDFFVCSDMMYDNERTQRARTLLVVLCAAVLITGMVLFMVINTFA